MTVTEMIEALKQYDGKLKVCVPDGSEEVKEAFLDVAKIPTSGTEYVTVLLVS